MANPSILEHFYLYYHIGLRSQKMGGKQMCNNVIYTSCIKDRPTKRVKSWYITASWFKGEQGRMLMGVSKITCGR